jgi:hypothetical protein
MKGLNPDSKGGTPTNVERIIQACEVERKKAVRRKFVAQLASHLCMVFHINPNEQALVMTLCAGNADNNREALKFWVETKLTDENKAEGMAYWEGLLARLLNGIGDSC